MPRPKITPQQRVAKTREDLGLTANAIQSALRAIDNGDAVALKEASAFLEAVGCYGRRTAEVLDQAPTPRASKPAELSKQKVAIIGPNLRDQSKGSFVVHAKECRDLAKLARSEPMARGENPLVFTAESRVEIAEAIYDNGIMEDGETGADYLHDFHFCPCVKLA
jgi:hypothetical protein